MTRDCTCKCEQSTYTGQGPSREPNTVSSLLSNNPPKPFHAIAEPATSLYPESDEPSPLPSCYSNTNFHVLSIPIARSSKQSHSSRCPHHNAVCSFLLSHTYAHVPYAHLPNSSCQKHGQKHLSAEVFSQSFLTRIIQ